jgi:hypothetical protein
LIRAASLALHLDAPPLSADHAGTAPTPSIAWSLAAVVVVVLVDAVALGVAAVVLGVAVVEVVGFVADAAEVLDDPLGPSPLLGQASVSENRAMAVTR